MKPSGMASPPQRARRSAVLCTPPKLVAWKIKLACSQEALSLCFSFKYKADDRAVMLHLSNCKSMSRILWKARIAHKLHLWSNDSLSTLE
jgi:hypothetical protein